jgi:hypothetical protein
MAPVSGGQDLPGAFASMAWDNLGRVMVLALTLHFKGSAFG